MSFLSFDLEGRARVSWWDNGGCDDRRMEMEQG